LLKNSFEKAYYSYQDAFEYLNPFAVDLLNASYAMLQSEPNPQLLCQWNGEYFKQTGTTLIEQLKRTDQRLGTNYMAQLTPENWLDMEVCMEDREFSLQDELFEILMNDSLFRLNWAYKEGILNSKTSDAELQINHYGIYNILPLNRFIISKNFIQQNAGQWVMNLIEEIIKNNANLNISPLLRGMKYKVQIGDIDNRYFSQLFDHMVSHHHSIKQEFNLLMPQMYFTIQVSYDTLDTYPNFSDDELAEINEERAEIHLFDYKSFIDRINYYRKTHQFFNYHQSIIWSDLSDKSMQRILEKVDHGELLLFD